MLISLGRKNAVKCEERARTLQPYTVIYTMANHTHACPSNPRKRVLRTPAVVAERNTPPSLLPDLAPTTTGIPGTVILLLGLPSDSVQHELSR